MSQYATPVVLSPGDMLDALDQAGVKIVACLPAGLASSAESMGLYHLLCPAGSSCLAEFLQCPAGRLQAEAKATGSLLEAFALLAEEKVRAGEFGFNDLLVRYTLRHGENGCSTHFLRAPTTIAAVAMMLNEAQRQRKGGRTESGAGAGG